MLEHSATRIEESLGTQALVLDVGGWARPFTRADWVIDIMPPEGRGTFGVDGRGNERFTPSTWVTTDICAREPWPFGDKQFDFVVCSHTLEDLRDPVWVCSEMVRVARAGYIEVPSRLEEQSYGLHGPWVGWAHHRWLVDVDETGISFVFKSHTVHRRRECHFPFGFVDQLSAEERVQTHWWDGSFEFGERIFLEAETLDEYLADYVRRGKEGRDVPGRWWGIARLVLDRVKLRPWGRTRGR